MRVGLASFIGTTVEFYDFLIYGTAAALVFPKLFFPAVSPATGLLLSFATFGVGFVARPLGGVVFGHFGRRRFGDLRDICLLPTGCVDALACGSAG